MTVSSEKSIPFLLGRLWHHLGARRRRSFVWLLLLMLISAIAEMISLGSVLPFIAVLAVPDKLFQNPVIASVVEKFGISSADQLVLPLTLVFVFAAIATAAIRLLVIWRNTRLTYVTGADISMNVYRRTLYQPYSVHTSRSSSETISGITGKVGQTMLGILLPLLTLISCSLLLCAIIATLIIVDPLVAILAATIFGSCYVLISWFTRNRLKRNGQYIAAEHTQVVKSLQEGLGGIRDVLLHGTQTVYCESYGKSDLRWRIAQGENVFIGQSPRFVMEAIGMTLIATLAYHMSRQSGGLAASLPLLAALALGAQRLLPALQQAYGAWASIIGSKAVFADTIALLDQPLPKELLSAPPPPLSFARDISMHDLSFSYPGSDQAVLKKLNLVITKGSRVGFVGTTGSGKSTLMDLLMGLLEPDTGNISIDGNRLDKNNVRAWQQCIAHVPQNIFLSDATLAENIAFGERRESIDMERVRKAAERAQLAEFVAENAEGYDAIVGERGVRLSGGQRQRIGIARALYRSASILVLDEATSALDNETERSVMRAIEGLERDLTVLIIAHRLSTVRSCDLIVQLEHGSITAQGNYSELLESNEQFRRSVHAAHTQ